MAKHRTGHLFKRGNAFYVRWTIEGKIFSKALRDDAGQSITNRREANEARTKFMATFFVADEASALESIAAKLEGRRAELVRIEDAQNPALPIAKTWVAFIEAPNRPNSGESTLRQYECQFNAFRDWMSEKHHAATALRDVTKEIAEEYAAHLTREKLSPNTYNKHLNLLTLVFRVLRDKARLAGNPWADFQRKHLTTQSRRELTFKELCDVCQSATGELKLLLALGVYSGLRLGDCATLRWAEVDTSRGIIRRVPLKTKRRNPKPVIVPIHPVLRDILAETGNEPRGEYVMPETAAEYLRRTDLVTDRIQRHFITRGIRPHKPGTGTNGERAVVEVGFHSLRHTFVSLCRESNAPLAVVQSLVGHSNPSMTRHYTHVGELAASRAVAALPSIIGEEPAFAKKPGSERELLAKIRNMVMSIGDNTWKETKERLLAILPIPDTELEVESVRIENNSPSQEPKE